MAVSMSAALATPLCRASTAPLTSMATVRVTTRPGASSITYTVRPAACRSPVASSTAPAARPSDAAIAMPSAVASSRVRSTTTAGRPSAVVEAPLGDQPGDPVPDRGDRPAGGAFGGVVHDDRMAGHGGNLRDPGAHGAGPDHGDRRGLRDPADLGHSGTTGSGGGSGSPCMITAACARNSTRRILPVDVVGYSVTNTIRRGRLKDGSPARQNAISASSSPIAPGLSRTKATGFS